jgi:hypothetical protein
MLRHPTCMRVDSYDHEEELKRKDVIQYEKEKVRVRFSLENFMKTCLLCLSKYASLT